MRILILVVLLVFAGLAFAPTGVPLAVFSAANLSKVPSTLISAGRFDQLDFYATTLAVNDHVEARGPGLPQPETLLTHARGRVFSGEKQMVAFALERAFVARDIQGWEAAATQCFDKKAADLALSDAAVLIIHMRSPWTAWNGQGDELMERRNAVLRGMAANGYATNDEASAAVSAPLTYCRAS